MTHLKRERLLREIHAASVRKFKYDPDKRFRRRPRGSNVRFTDYHSLATLARLTSMSVREFQRTYTR